MTTCIDCIPCEADGCTAPAYCLSQPGTHPCPHDGPWCENCLENCQECADRIEYEMTL